MRRRAFTLLEMALATALAALLMGGVLLAASGLMREQKAMERRLTDIGGRALFDVFRHDLSNSAAAGVSAGGDELILIGHAGLDPFDLGPTSRLSRIRYILRGGALLREQAYLDDPLSPQPVTEAVATGVKSWRCMPMEAPRPRRLSDDVAARAGLDARMIETPERMRILIRTDIRDLEQEVRIR